MALTRGEYFELKAIELEGQLLQQQMQASWAAFQARRAAAYGAVGLDPQQTYKLDEANAQFVPVMSDTPTEAA